MSDVHASTNLEQHILVVCRSAPYGSSLAREALETALAAGAMGAQITMLFLDEGVWQLVDQHKPEAIGRKNHGAMLSALPIYDIDEILIDQASLEKRGLGASNLNQIAQLNSAQLLNAQTTRETLASHHLILSF